MARRLALLALILLACRSVSFPLVSAPTATPVRPRLNPPDSIAVGLAREPSTLAAPPLEGDAARWIGQLLFSQLVGLDDTARPRADLAESVPTVENGGARWVGEAEDRRLVVTFKLRAGAMWNDGQPVTARDVVFTWRLALNPGFGSAIATERRYEKVEAVDDATALFTFFSERSARAAAAREPARYGFLRDQRGPVVDPLYLYGLPGWWVYPAHALGPLVDGAPRTSPKAVEALAKGEFALRPVGSGPFRVEDGLRLAARPEYFGGAPKTARLLLRAAGAGALARGEVDALVGSPADSVEAGPGLRVDRVPDAGWERLDLNLANDALRDPAVRQAIDHAVDTLQLRQISGGFPIDGLPGAARPRVVVVPGPAGAEANKTPKGPPPRGASPDAANRLLADAGWALGADGVRQKGGERLQVRLVTTDAPLRTRLAGAIAQQLAQVGIETRVEARPAAELFDRPGGRLARRDFDLALYASVGGLDAVADLAAWYATGSIPSPRSGFGGDNVVGLASPEIDHLVAEAATALDPTRRLDLLREASDAVAREYVTVPLFSYPRVVARDARFEGLAPVSGLVGESWNAASWRFRA